MQPSESNQVRRGALIAATRRTLGAGKSQVWLAGEVGVHPQYISEIERGLVPGSQATRRRIADALGLNPALLLDTEEAKAS